MIKLNRCLAFAGGVLEPPCAGRGQEAGHYPMPPSVVCPRLGKVWRRVRCSPIPGLSATAFHPSPAFSLWPAGIPMAWGREVGVGALFPISGKSHPGPGYLCWGLGGASLCLQGWEAQIQPPASAWWQQSLSNAGRWSWGLNPSPNTMQAQPGYPCWGLGWGVELTYACDVGRPGFNPLSWLPVLYSSPCCYAQASVKSQQLG